MGLVPLPPYREWHQRHEMTDEEAPTNEEDSNPPY